MQYDDYMKDDVKMYSAKIVAENVQILTKGDSSDSPAKEEKPKASQPQPEPDPFDDDIPF
jgi:single-stranded DNA-binding protein